MFLPGLSRRVFAISCLAFVPSELAKKAKGPETMEECEDAEEPTFKRPFPRGVLNPRWANDRNVLKSIRRALRRGRPVVISDFLEESVAEALAQQMEHLADKQDDNERLGDGHGGYRGGSKGLAAGLGYPFQRWTEGSLNVPLGWRPADDDRCTRIVDDFLDERDRRLGFISHVLVGRQQDSHTGWYRGFQYAMEQPASRRFWKGLVDLPSHANHYDQSWSWLRPGDFYGLHSDDAQLRYLAVTLHLTRGWQSAESGGEYIWCGPEDAQDFHLESPDRPHFYKSFNVSRNGTTLTPGFNVAVVFPIHQNSYHAVGPIHARAQGRRFTLQGWYIDPCQHQPPGHACAEGAMTSFQKWSEQLNKKGGSTSPLRVGAAATFHQHSEL